MKTSILFLAVVCGAIVAALPLSAHHELRAEFDEQKPVSLRGVVTRFEWNNPHAFLYVDAQDANGEIANWAVEWASPLELRMTGWLDAYWWSSDDVRLHYRDYPGRSDRPTGPTLR